MALCLTLTMWVSYAEDAFFDEAVFVGDSILRSVGRYVAQRRREGESPLGEASFLAADGYTLYAGSLRTIDPERINLTRNGVPVTVPDGIKATKARRAFVMLGLNDGAGSQLEKHLGFYERMITRILEKNPGLELIILSVTPVVKTAQAKRLSQLAIDRFNQGLEGLCGERGIAYLDVSSALKDEEGYLNRDFSSDRRVHLNDLGIEALIKTLHDYAGARAALQEGGE